MADRDRTPLLLCHSGPDEQSFLLELPEEPTRLSLLPRDGIRLDRVEAKDHGEGWLLEPIRRATTLLLAVASARGVSPTRINGQPKPRLTAMKPGDEIQLGSSLAAHYVVLRKPRIQSAGLADEEGSGGRSAARYVGRECPVCRVPFDTDTRIYVCPAGCGIHLEESNSGGTDKEVGTQGAEYTRDPEVQNVDVLECARTLKNCPSCGGEIVLEERYEGLTHR